MPFSFSSTNPVEFRWDIGTFDIYDTAADSTNTLLLSLDNLDSSSNFYNTFADIAVYSADNPLLTLTLLLVLLMCSLQLLTLTIELAFRLDDYDSIYRQLTANNRRT